MNTLADGLTRHMRRLAAGRPADDGRPIHWTDFDQQAQDALHARQASNRNNAYRRTLPLRYADAAYAALNPDQDPQGKITRWLECGPRTLLLSGPPRTGKTTAAYAIANDAHAHGMWVVARPAADLSHALKPDREPLAYTYACDCDLLLLDDLGHERATEWWIEQLQLIVDARCANQRRLLVTTNTLDMAVLSDRYGPALAERLVDGGGLLRFDGPPIRTMVEEW
jgi:DNA replication protein DnaC